MSEYEAAWKDGEEGNLPPANDVKATAQAEADRQAQEFSDAFNKDEYAPSGVGSEGETQVATVAKADEALKAQAEPGDAPEKAQPVQSDEQEILDADAKAKAV